MNLTPVDSGDVLVEDVGRTVVVTFNRPGKHNALTQSMYGTIADVLEQADADRSVAVVVLTGSGKTFTSGNDLNEFASGGSLVEVRRFLEAIAGVNVPIVAAVNGSAIGVGLTMLLHCDLVFVEPNAHLSAPFVGLGLVPEAASSLLLPRVIGERRASEVLLAGRGLTGDEAAAWGLANAAVSPVLPAALEVAGRLGVLPPNALRATKALLRSNELTVSSRMKAEREVFVNALTSPEFAEATAARKEKRSPVF
jgi:enoyl-CoA hydratase/carnithine racemase